MTESDEDGAESSDVVPSDDVEIVGAVAEVQQFPELKGLLQLGQTQSSWIGPLPPPGALAGYAELLPDAPERILSMAERDLDSRIAREDKLAQAAIDTAKSGQAIAGIIALAAVTAAIVFFALHNVVGGSVMLSVPVVLLVRALLGQVGSGRSGDGDSEGKSDR